MRQASEDDLLAPSLQDVRLARLGDGERPWRLSSQVYVAFVGGALAVAVIALDNARRLGAPQKTQRWIIALGALGVAVSVIVSYFLDDFGSSSWIGYRVVGVLLAGALYKLQQPADRVYSFRTSGDEDQQYDSLWGPGLVAALGGGLVQLGIVYAGVELIHALVGP
jgi:hypothetical protein